MHPGTRGSPADQRQCHASIDSRGSSGYSGCARPTARRDSSVLQTSRQTAGGRMRSRYRSSHGSGNETRTGIEYFLQCVQERIPLVCQRTEPSDPCALKPVLCTAA